ncbi:MAG: 1-(5-phosphoribosyl)-5-[(5-phosphoribosylamino)methylideneamino]imidazole-4-carboxamide isomerase [Flavobacteriales bacterium]|nr:1-(5-phosphoribosyl)-5-[(5-phosphoribosylamino)methylideneamino]imidazole-4-carboxamide isomerase [Flavobacteriales bacterium]
MKIIPAIDIIEGKCVRLTQGDYSRKKIYNENPVEVAKSFEASGIQYLHLVDLDGAKSKKVVNHKILEQIASQTKLQIDFGGGVKSQQDLDVVFNSGAQQVTVGSLAVVDPDLVQQWLEAYSDRIILGADCKNQKIATHGWLETSELYVLDFINEYLNKGASYVICTDIAKDGMLEGPSYELYEKLIDLKNIKLIASGGVRNIEDLERLEHLGCEAVIIGKAIYENTIKLEDLLSFQSRH